MEIIPKPDVIVSTESDDIATIARRFGAEAPVLREASLADDYTTVSLVSEFLSPEMAGGAFSISIAASIKMIDFQFWENDAVPFEVNDTGGVRGTYQGGWRGVIRPILERRTELRSGGQIEWLYQVVLPLLKRR